MGGIKKPITSEHRVIMKITRWLGCMTDSSPNRGGGAWGGKGEREQDLVISWGLVLSKEHIEWQFKRKGNRHDNCVHRESVLLGWGHLVLHRKDRGTRGRHGHTYFAVHPAELAFLNSQISRGLKEVRPEESLLNGLVFIATVPRSRARPWDERCDRRVNRIHSRYFQEREVPVCVHPTIFTHKKCNKQPLFHLELMVNWIVSNQQTTGYKSEKRE